MLPDLLEFVYLRGFERTRGGVLADEEMQELEAELLVDPAAGDVIAGTGGLRKIRVRVEGRGKRGGARVIYLHVPLRQTVYFLFAYPKNVQENLTGEQRDRLRMIALEIRGEAWPYGTGATGVSENRRTIMYGEKEAPVEVTDRNFGELLVESMEEALRVSRGEAEPARRAWRVDLRGASVRPPRQYEGPAIQRIRERLGLSQALFADVLNATPDTVRAWEQGKREPNGMALALLEVAERHPDALMDRLRGNPGSAPGEDG